jgi:hypothetical protein
MAGNDIYLQPEKQSGYLHPSTFPHFLYHMLYFFINLADATHNTVVYIQSQNSDSYSLDSLVSLKTKSSP